MIKVILKTLFGLIVAFLGFYLFFIGISKLNSTGEFSLSSFLILFSSVILVLGGGAILIFAGSSNESVIKKHKFHALSYDSSDNLSQTLDKNNELVSNWRNTAHMRDKLKMIRVTAEDKNKTRSI